MTYTVFKNGQQVADYPSLLEASHHARTEWFKSGGDWQVQDGRDHVHFRIRDEMYRERMEFQRGPLTVRL